MDDDEQDLVEVYTNGSPPFFSSYDLIEKGDGQGIIEELLGCVESNAMLPAIRAVFLDIPFETHHT